jgi:ceramide glucosyltransferase
MPTALGGLAAVCAVLALAGAAYYALCIWAGLRFAASHSSHSTSAFTPPVSMMKSLKGVDPHMYAAFRSHCLLEYPQYEVLFGVADLNDPAAALVRELQQEFPQVALRIVHCPQVLGTNGKISNLAQALPQARYEHVLINDSDILVEPDFLRRVMRCFADSRVGVVTTLYRGAAGRSLWSKLEALGISTDFMGGVLVAREMEGGLRFALGATMTTTKSVLAKIGGIKSLVEVLADDYELGARAATAGYRVELADAVVETAVADYGWREFWRHQMRWARNIKDRRLAQYFGLIVTFALSWAVLAVIAAPRAWWAWAVLGVTTVARFAAAYVVGSRVLRPKNASSNSVEDEQNVTDFRVVSDYVSSLSQSWLIPLRDFVALFVWLASFFGNTVVWRGERFQLKDGRLYRLT